MGKGLQIEDRGIHLAFCAGTGVLVYLDLVGHLILRNSLPFIQHNSTDCKKMNSKLSIGNMLRRMSASGLNMTQDEKDLGKEA